MLQPKKTKFRKQFRGKMGGVATANNSLSFGSYGLKSVGRAWVTSNQIESARRAISGYTKRKGKLWVKVFPDKPITNKPNNSKMNNGKGDVVGYVVVIKPGTILFELGGVSEDVARRALQLAANKLPIKCKFVSKNLV